MPILTGTIDDVTGSPLPDRVPLATLRVTVRAPSRRSSLTEQARLVASVPVPVEVSPTGEISVELEPGPAVMLVEGEGLRDVYELGVTADMTLLTEALQEMSPTRSWVESQMVQLRSQTVTAAGAAQAAKSDAEGAASVAEGHRTHVDAIRELLDEAAQTNVAPYLTDTALKATYGRRTHRYDIREFIETGDGAFSTDGSWEDSAVVLDRALRQLRTQTAINPVQVFYPNGTYPLELSTLMPGRSGVAGESEKGTVFKPAPTITPFTGGGVFASPAPDIHFTDLTIDCSNQDYPNYSTHLKAMHLNYLLRPVWRRITVMNSWGTALGCDYLVDYTMDHVTAIGAGRGIREKGLNPLAVSGGSGIGIGTGAYEYEGGRITSPRLEYNSRAGLFGELLNHAGYGKPSKGVVISGGWARNNYIGLHDAGWDSLSSTMDLTDNDYAGLLVDKTTLIPYGGSRGRVNARIDGNGSPDLPNSGGVVFGQAPEGGYHVSGTGRGNYRGVTTLADCDLGPDITIDMEITESTSDGVLIRSNKPVERITVSGSSKLNGRDGARVEAPTEGLTLTARCTDNQGLGVRIDHSRVASTLDATLAADARRNVEGGWSIAEPGVTAHKAMIGQGVWAPGPPAWEYADSLDRPNNPSALGFTDGGSGTPQQWTVFGSGTWGIEDKAARVTSGTALSAVAINVGRPGGIHQVVAKKVFATTSGGLAFRVQDASNLMYVRIEGGVYKITKRVAGTNAPVGTNQGVAFANGDLLRVVDTGTKATLYVNGVVAAETTDTRFNDQTLTGLHGNYPSDPNSRWSHWAWAPLT